MPKCYILSGAPLSGKSTWAKKQGLPIISCDELRKIYTGGTYKFDPKIEKEIWQDFYYRIACMEKTFIVDNTNCKQTYITKIMRELPVTFEVEFVRFEIPLWKSYYRNVIRWMFTGKWIPLKVIKNMKRNYKQLWG
jgi:predicted kinase